MNAKKAKALRKLMKNMAAQQKPDEKLPEVAYREITSRAKYVMVQGKESVKEAGQVQADDAHVQASSVLGAPESNAPTEEAGIEANHVERIAKENSGLERVKIATGQVIVDPQSQRAVYKHLKKELVKVEAARRA